MKYLTCFLLNLFFSAHILAQTTDFSGVWTGVLLQNAGGLAEKYKFSITISQDAKGNITGSSKIEIHDAKDYGVISLTGKAQKNGVTIQEHKLIEHKLRENAYWCIKNYTLQYNKKNEQLSGNWTAEGDCEPGTMELTRQINPQTIAQIKKKKPKKVATTEQVITNTATTNSTTATVTKGEIAKAEKLSKKLPENYLSIDEIKIALQANKSVIGKKVILDNIYFQQSTSTLLANSHESLLKIVKIMQENSNLRIKVSGHTDNIGNEHSNLQLSRLRAIAVMNYLIDKGIAENRIIAEGMGSSFPIRPNDTEQNKQQNRRVEFEVL